MLNKFTVGQPVFVIGRIKGNTVIQYQDIGFIIAINPDNYKVSIRNERDSAFLTGAWREVIIEEESLISFTAQDLETFQEIIDMNNIWIDSWNLVHDSVQNTTVTQCQFMYQIAKTYTNDIEENTKKLKSYIDLFTNH